MPTIHRFLLALTASAFLAACATTPATDRNPGNKLYRCDRNGTQEERQAC